MFVTRNTSFTTVPIELVENATNPQFNFSNFQTHYVGNMRMRLG
jgi:hypothetical protein